MIGAGWDLSRHLLTCEETVFIEIIVEVSANLRALHKLFFSAP